jgi:uncharacterized protein (UPF0332 family)
LLQGGQPEFAAARGYYAMFYVAEALLFERGLEFSKHSGVHAAFGEYFAKTRQMDPEFHRYLLEAFESRLDADYGVDISLGRDATAELIGRATEFLTAAREHLSKAP